MKVKIKSEVLMADFEAFCRSHNKKSSLNDIEWLDMSIGWFLAKGATVRQAMHLASKAAYHHEYWLPVKCVIVNKKEGTNA